MNIIRLRKVWYAVSVVLVGSSILSVAMFGLKQGIDFTGGSSLSIRFDERPTPTQIEASLASLELGGMTVQPVGERDVNLRMKTLTEDAHQKVLSTLSAAYGKATELQFDSVGPSVGEELRTKSLTALFVVFLSIMAFVAWSFRKVTAPVQSWKYGVITIITAFHDVILPIGVFAILGKLYGDEIGTPFIAAVLTVMGYSINDTIVVFDRVRENLQKTSGTFEEIVERSVQQTKLRSFNTSMTTLLTMIAVYLFGGASIKDFSLALIVGIATGTYSSIFIASPLLVTWNAFSAKRRARK